MKTLFEISQKGKRAHQIPTSNVPEYNLKQEFLSETEIELPEADVITLNAHYQEILNSLQSEVNDLTEVPSALYWSDLGEQIANLRGFKDIHPLRKKRDMQGSIEMIFRTQEYLKGISGASAVSLLATCQAQAEFVLLKMVKKYYKLKGADNKNLIILPINDTIINPEIASMLGFEVQYVPVNDNGFIDYSALEGMCNQNIALIAVNMHDQVCQIEKNILKIPMLVRDNGALCMVKAIQTQPFAGILRGIELGYDFMILNGADFSNNHCVGGDGVYPLCVSEKVADLLPAPLVIKDKSGSFSLGVPENSIGSLRNYYGNFEGVAKIYCYLAVLGRDGLKNASEMAVLNANYLMKLLEKHNSIKQTCLDRFMFKAKNANCANQKLREGVIIKVSSTQSKQDLEEIANLIIEECEKIAF